MISNPEHGWCDFDLGDFHGTPSYITNVPVDLLQAFSDAIHNGYGMAWFNEEGSEFTLVITPYSLFIIEENEEGEAFLHDFSDLNISELAQEVVTDVKTNIAVWSRFSAFDDAEIMCNHNELEELISKIE